MYDIFLVEDEILIREGIKSIIPWAKHGFNFVGEASDGELAWPMIQKLKPDIVVTDIKMPFMDGLELSRLIQKEFPETTIIILSGYDDFSYAREAINIGVSQYLLKPISKEQLLEVLIEVKEKKDREVTQEQYNLQFAKEVESYLFTSQRAFFDSLISGEYNTAKLLQRAEKLGLDLVAQCYNMVLFLLEEDLFIREYSPMISQVQEEIEKSFVNSENIIAFSAGMGVTAYLIKGSESTINQHTEYCINTLSEICGKLNNVDSWEVVFGEPVERISAISRCYKVARQKLFARSGDDYKQIEESESSLVMDFDLNQMDGNQMDSRLIEKFLLNGLPEDVQDFTEQYFESFGTKALESVILRHYVVLNTQFTVNTFLEKIEIDDKNQLESLSQKEKLEKALSTMEGSREYVEELFTYCINQRDKFATNRYREMLAEVVEYMEENYSDPDIDLNAVAQIANMSPSYFSAVFSQEKGETFVECLTGLRMKKARELLKTTSGSSSEIAMAVGYNDPNYFSFLFKKINGSSPRQYRTGGR